MPVGPIAVVGNSARAPTAPELRGRHLLGAAGVGNSGDRVEGVEDREIGEVISSAFDWITTTFCGRSEKYCSMAPSVGRGLECREGCGQDHNELSSPWPGPDQLPEAQSDDYSSSGSGLLHRQCSVDFDVDQGLLDLTQQVHDA